MAKSSRREERRTERKERRRAGSARRDAAMKSKGRTTIKIPDGVKLFAPEDKKYRLDIVPYEVGKGNPHADEGDWYYERTFFTHRIGADNRYVVCPAKTWGKPCPVCEELARVMRDPDSTEEEEKSLKPSQRQLWLVRNRDDEDAGVQLFESSWYLFGRIVDELRQDADDDEEHITQFDDHEAGAILHVKFSKNPPYGLQCLSVEFRPRPNGLPEDLLEHGICLDDLLVETPYDQIKKILFQIPEEDSEDKEEKKPSKKEAPAKKKPPKKVVEEDDDEPEDDDSILTADSKGIKKGSNVEYEGEEMVVTRISGDGTSLTLKDSDDEVYKAVAVDEVTLLPDTDDDEPEEAPKAPAKKRGRPPKKVVEPVVEEPEDDDEPDDDDPEDDDDDWDFDDDNE